MRGGWTGATGVCALVLTACSQSATDGGGASVAPPDACPDVRLAPGAVAASIAFGYDARAVATGEGAGVRLCLQGFPNKSVSVTAPPGVEVSPATLTTGGTGKDVLMLTVTARSGPGGALAVQLEDAGGHVAARSGGPSVVVDGTTWRLAKQP